MVLSLLLCIVTVMWFDSSWYILSSIMANPCGGDFICKYPFNGGFMVMPVSTVLCYPGGMIIEEDAEYISNILLCSSCCAGGFASAFIS